MDILFRFLGQDDGLSSTTQKARTNIEQLKTSVNGSTTSFSQMEAKAKQAGISAQSLGEARSHVTGLGNDVQQTGSKVDKLKDSFSAVKVAAGLALTGAGMYLENFVKQCITASVQVQQSMLAIGGSMGLDAVQSLAQGPKINQMVEDTMDATGQNAEDLKKILPSVQAVAGHSLKKDQTSMEAISDIQWAKQGTGMTLSSAADKYNKMVTTGSGMALGDIGLTLSDMGLTGTQFQKMTPAARKKAMDAAIFKKEGGENAAMKDSTIAKEHKFENALTKFEAKLGDTFMPAMTTLMDVGIKLMNAMPKNKYFLDIVGGLLLFATGLALIGGPLLMLYPLLAKAGGGIKSLGGRIKGLFGIGKGGGKGGSAASMISDKVCSCMNKNNGGSSGSNSGSSSSKGKGKGKGKGKFGRFGNFLSDEEGTVSSGRFGRLGGLLGKIGIGGGVLGEGEELAGGAGKLGGLAGKLGSVGRIAGMGLDAIPGLGEIMMAGTAVAGGIGGWQATKGNAGDKAKGAVGGAVEALSFGLVNRQQVVGGINYVGGAVSKMVPKIKRDLGNVWKIISTPFIQGYNYAKGAVSNGANFITSKVNWLVNFDKKLLGDAYNFLKSTWTNILNDVKKELTNIENAIVGAGQAFYKSATNLGQSIWNGVKKGLGINSPGFMYHTIRGEFENIHGMMGSYHTIFGDKAKGMGANMVKGFQTPLGSAPSGSSAIGGGFKAVHYHAPITIDASHMSHSELKALMIEVNERALKPHSLPTIASTTSAATGGV